MQFVVGKKNATQLGADRKASHISAQVGTETGGGQARVVSVQHHRAGGGAGNLV